MQQDDEQQSLDAFRREPDVQPHESLNMYTLVCCCQPSPRNTGPTFCPLGPAIVTADEIPEPHNLQIRRSDQ